MFIILKNATRTGALGTRTRLYHPVLALVLNNFKSCVLVLDACVLDSSTAHDFPHDDAQPYIQVFLPTYFLVCNSAKLFSLHRVKKRSKIIIFNI